MKLLELLQQGKAYMEPLIRRGLKACLLLDTLVKYEVHFHVNDKDAHPVAVSEGEEVSTKKCWSTNTTRAAASGACVVNFQFTKASN